MKKGESSLLTLETLIKIIVLVPLLIIVIVGGGKALSIFLPSASLCGEAESSFSLLKGFVDGYVGGTYSGEDTLSLKLGNECAVVGFSGADSNDLVERSSMCKGKSCLCLCYYGSNDVLDGADCVRTKKCEVFKDISVFSGDNGGQVNIQDRVIGGSNILVNLNMQGKTMFITMDKQEVLPIENSVYSFLSGVIVGGEGMYKPSNQVVRSLEYAQVKDKGDNLGISRFVGASLSNSQDLSFSGDMYYISSLTPGTDQNCKDTDNTRCFKNADKRFYGRVEKTNHIYYGHDDVGFGDPVHRDEEPGEDVLGHQVYYDGKDLYFMNWDSGGNFVNEFTSAFALGIVALEVDDSYFEGYDFEFNDAYDQDNQDLVAIAAAESGVPIKLALALALHESGDFEHRLEANGDYYGLMQINKVKYPSCFESNDLSKVDGGLCTGLDGCKDTTVLDLDCNIGAGLKLLMEKSNECRGEVISWDCGGVVAEYTGWQCALRKYKDDGVCKDTTADYVTLVTEKVEEFEVG